MRDHVPDGFLTPKRSGDHGYPVRQDVPILCDELVSAPDYRDVSGVSVDHAFLGAALRCADGQRGGQVLSSEQIEAGALPDYPEAAKEAVRARYGPDAEVTPYDVVMLRLADPVYAVLWKGFNILFLIFALHHGFYGLNNILTDYIRNPIGRVLAQTLSWTLALALLIVGLYSIIVAGWGTCLHREGQRGSDC